MEMNLKLNAVQYLVFDEADRLFEMGFADQLKVYSKKYWIIEFSGNNQKVARIAPNPALFGHPSQNASRLCQSRTFRSNIGWVNIKLLFCISSVRLDVESKLSEKLSMVFALCRQTEKLPVLLTLCRSLCRHQKKTIIFCATMKHVEFLVAVLREAGMDPAFLYSQLDPVARKQNIARFWFLFRNKLFFRFRTEECPLLVVTDIAARGVDIPLLDFAINFHFPPRPKLFVHRVGRVARAGKSGTALSLVGPDEVAYLLDLFLFLGRPMQLVDCGKQQKWNENGLI